MIQSVLIPVEWGMEKAKAWLKDHKYKPIKKAHETKNFLRFRVEEPDFKRYSIYSLKNGVKFVIGHD